VESHPVILRNTSSFSKQIPVARDNSFENSCIQYTSVLINSRAERSRGRPLSSPASAQNAKKRQRQTLALTRNAHANDCETSWLVDEEPDAASRKLSQRVPVVEKMWVLGLQLVVNRLHLERRETNPVAARRTTTDETGAVPPRSDQRLVNSFRIAVRLELEVDPLHMLRATRMGASGFVVMDVR
jgi:hypothetical protein